MNSVDVFSFNIVEENSQSVIDLAIAGGTNLIYGDPSETIPIY